MSATASSKARKTAGAGELHKVVDEQETRKRKLVDALFADDDDVEKGCRWAGIRGPGLRSAMAVPTDYEKEGVVVRIDAVAGNHFVFQSPVLDDSQYGHATLVVERDELEVVWIRNCSSVYTDALERVYQRRFRDDEFRGG